MKNRTVLSSSATLAVLGFVVSAAAWGSGSSGTTIPNQSCADPNNYTCANQYYNSNNPFQVQSILQEDGIILGYNIYSGDTLQQNPEVLMSNKMPSPQAMQAWNNTQADNICNSICNHQHVGPSAYWYQYQDASGHTVPLQPPAIECVGSDPGVGLTTCGNVAGAKHPLTNAQLGWNPSRQLITSLTTTWQNGYPSVADLAMTGQVQSLKCLSPSQAEATGYCCMASAPGMAVQANVQLGNTIVANDLADMRISNASGGGACGSGYHGFDIQFPISSSPGASVSPNIVCGTGGLNSALPLAPGVSPFLSCAQPVNTYTPTASQTQALKQDETGAVTSFSPDIVAWSQMPMLAIYADGKQVATVNGIPQGQSSTYDYDVPLSSLKLLPGSHVINVKYLWTNDLVAPSPQTVVTTAAQSGLCPNVTLASDSGYYDATGSKIAADARGVYYVKTGSAFKVKCDFGPLASGFTVMPVNVMANCSSAKAGNAVVDTCSGLSGYLQSQPPACRLSKVVSGQNVICATAPLGPLGTQY